MISEFENSRYCSIKIKSSDTTTWRRADYRATYRSLLLESKSSDTTTWRRADYRATYRSLLLESKSSDTTTWRRADYRATYRSLLLESKSSATTIWRKADWTKGCWSLTIRRAHWLECWWSRRQIRDPTFCITYIWIYIYYNNFIAIYLKF